MARPLAFLLYTGLTRRSGRRHLDHLDRQVSDGILSDAARNERLALGLAKRAKGEMLWLHAANGAALRPAVELFGRVREDRPELNGLITLGPDVQPPNSLLPDGLTFAALPEDDGNIVRRFLTHWDPDGLVWIGGQFRPVLLQAVSERAVPMMSIDAPKSAKTLDCKLPIPGLRSRVLACFDHVVNASPDSVGKWRRAGLSAAQIETLGYLEEGGIAPPIDEDALSQRLEDIKTRPVWFASRIATTEVREVIRAHKRALRRAHRLLLAVTLDDLSTVETVLAQFRTAGLHTISLDSDREITEADQVVVVNGSEKDRTTDGLWHRIAPISFLGQSIAPMGGIDPYPAAAMGSAILHGAHIDTHVSAYARLAAQNASCTVKDGYDLGEEVGRLLSPDHAALMAAAAWETASTGTEVTDRVSALVQDFLDLRERLER